MCYSERKCDFFSKPAKGSIFALQCDWKSKKSQNFPVFGAFKKNRWIFFRENLIFVRKNINILKNDKGSRLTLECESIIKFLKTFKNWLSFHRKKVDGFSKKNLEFYKIAKNSKFAVKCDWKHKVSQNVQNLALLNKVYVFFGKKMWFFLKKCWR